MYEQLVSGVILRPNDDGSTTSIPPDEANSDYRDYLAWVAEGNEATVQPIPVPVVAPDPDDELEAGITAANTLEELKAALLGKTRAGKVKGQPRA